MQAFHDYAMTVLWLAWLAYWCVSAASTKPTACEEGWASRLSHIVPLAVGIGLMATEHVPLAALNARMLPRTIVWFWIGLVLVASGLALSVAARLHLGRNWSGMVTLKQGHELIRSGPYRWARHPIYTGLLVAVVGSCIARGEWRGPVVLALVAGALLRKIAIEERFLTQQFGAVYARYQADVPALIPLPWRYGRHLATGRPRTW